MKSQQLQDKLLTMKFEIQNSTSSQKKMTFHAENLVLPQKFSMSTNCALSQKFHTVSLYLVIRLSNFHIFMSNVFIFFIF